MRRLIAPLAVLGLATFVALGGIDHGLGSGRLLAVTRGALLAALLLALHFRRGRLASVTLLTAVVAELASLLTAEATSLGGLGELGRHVLVALVTLLVPFVLGVLALATEWRPLGRPGALRLVALTSLAGGAWWLASAYEARHARVVEGVDWLRRPFLLLPEGFAVPLPDASVLLFALALVATGWIFARRRNPFEAALLATVPALAVAMGALRFVAEPTSATAALERLQIATLATAVILVLGLLQGAFSLAFEDGLTGLPARRALEESLQQLGRTYAVAMVDIDHFKKLNDRHGHEVGDQVLRMVGAMLARAPGGCSAYRYGGEEFTLLFPGKSAAEAQPFADALRGAIAERRFAVRSPDRPKKKPKGGKRPGGTIRKELRVTVSIGIADRTPERPRPAEVMKAADKALYRSKRGGRNRVTRG